MDGRMAPMELPYADESRARATRRHVLSGT